MMALAGGTDALTHALSAAKAAASEALAALALEYMFVSRLPTRLAAHAFDSDDTAADVSALVHVKV